MVTFTSVSIVQGILCSQHSASIFYRGRPMDEVTIRETTESRLLSLYLGPVVLKNQLSLKLYENFYRLSLLIYLSHLKTHSVFEKCG